MHKKTPPIELIKETLILTTAVAIIAAAVFFFLVPSHTSVSSISGLGIVLSNFVPLPLSAITMILNVVLLIIGFLTCGKEFGIKTVYTSIMLPLFLGLFEILFPDNASLTGSQELDVLCYILVVYIITQKEEELRNFILHDLHSGATIYESIGAYNMQKRNEIITIVDKSEYQKLMNYIIHEDPHAFVTVYTVSDMRYQPKL